MDLAGQEIKGVEIKLKTLFHSLSECLKWEMLENGAGFKPYEWKNYEKVNNQQAEFR